MQPLFPQDVRRELHELFGKLGTTLDRMQESLSIVDAIALQYGVPYDALQNAPTWQEHVRLAELALAAQSHADPRASLSDPTAWPDRIHGCDPMTNKRTHRKANQ